MKLVVLLFSLALLLISLSVVATEAGPRIAEIQAGLAELGYDPGPVDGLLGRKTRDAIMAFQKDQGLTVDGQYSDILYMLVESETERAPLLAMSDDELIKLLGAANEDEIGRLFDLIPTRVADFPITLTFGRSLPPDGTDVLFTIPLRLLLYAPSREGVEQFQADIGAEVTGELTLREFQEAHRRWLRQRDTPVYASGSADVYINDDLGRASVSGTWFTENEEIVTPINAVEITCDRERRECLDVTAELHVPSFEDDNSVIYLGRDAEDYYLRLRPVRRYRIISWSGDEIVALESRGCDVALLTLNRNANTVQEVVRNDEAVDPNCRIPPIPGLRIARLTSGWAIGREFWRKRQGATRSYLNPRVWEQVKQALGAAQTTKLPDPAVGPSDGTPPTAEELLRHSLQAPVNRRDE
jgi:peptidoglycan hydrolase-like protein with peptidoglycan-binding domain